MGKNKAASELSRLRWSKTTAEERSAHAAKMSKAAHAAMTPAERQARASKAGRANAAKHRGKNQPPE